MQLEPLYTPKKFHYFNKPVINKSRLKDFFVYMFLLIISLIMCLVMALIVYSARDNSNGTKDYINIEYGQFSPMESTQTQLSVALGKKDWRTAKSKIDTISNSHHMIAMQLMLETLNKESKNNYKGQYFSKEFTQLVEPVLVNFSFKNTKEELLLKSANDLYEKDNWIKLKYSKYAFLHQNTYHHFLNISYIKKTAFELSSGLKNKDEIKTHLIQDEEEITQDLIANLNTNAYVCQWNDTINPSKPVFTTHIGYFQAKRNCEGESNYQTYTGSPISTFNLTKILRYEDNKLAGVYSPQNWDFKAIEKLSSTDISNKMKNFPFQ